MSFRSSSFLCSLICWQVAFFPVAALVVYMNYVVVSWDQWLDRVGGTPNGLAILPLLRIDLFVVFIIMPVAISLVTYFWPGRSRWNILSIVAPILIVFLDVELHALTLLGNFASPSLVFEGIRWGLQNSALASAYVTLRSIVRLCLFMSATLSCLVLVKHRSFIDFVRKPNASMLAAIEIFVVLLCWVPRVQANPTTRSALTRLWSILSEKEAPILPLRTLQTSYKNLTDAPMKNLLPTYLFGRARRSNLIFFVMETLPARCLDLATKPTWAPALSNLSERAFIGLKHYSTYPFTVRAVYSIVTSMYPPELANFRYNVFSPSKGLLGSLKAHGYATGVYGDGVNVYGNLFRSQGVERMPNTCDSGAEAVNYNNRQWLQRQIATDQRCLDSMIRDLAQWIHAGRSFGAVYAPQVGHGPWQGLGDDLDVRDPLLRCQDLVALQDRWLATVVDFLRRHGKLEETIIVVTADHGVRTDKEDARFRRAMIDDYTFHVPLLLYAPMVLRKTENIGWVTSHIDIQPSVLDLLGISTGREFEQGTAIWDERLQSRTTYFWADGVFGSSGFHKVGRYYMWNRVVDSVFASDRLEFWAENRFAALSAPADSVRRELETMDLIRRSWLRCAQEDCESLQ